MDPKIAREAEAARALVEGLKALEMDSDEELVADTLEGETDLIDMIDQLVTAEDEDRILLDGLKARIDELTDRKRRFERRYKDRRTVIAQAMSIAELPSLQRPTYTMSFGITKPKPLVTEEADIPAEFFKAKPTLDRTALGTALRDGRDVPGACLTNGEPSITIRRK